jgi:hypothetical protein
VPLERLRELLRVVAAVGPRAEGIRSHSKWLAESS